MKVLGESLPLTGLNIGVLEFAYFWRKDGISPSRPDFPTLCMNLELFCGLTIGCLLSGPLS